MSKTSDLLVAASACLGFFAVALGAFGAHGLEGKISAEAQGWWETATLYGLVHAAAALAIGLNTATRWTRRGGWALVTGSALFAATLYTMALGAPRWFGAITPIGGLIMLAGWALLVASAFRSTD